MQFIVLLCGEPANGSLYYSNHRRGAQKSKNAHPEIRIFCREIGVLQRKRWPVTSRMPKRSPYPERIRPGTVIYSGLKFVSLTPPSRLRRIADRRNNDTIRWILNTNSLFFCMDHIPWIEQNRTMCYHAPGLRHHRRIDPEPKFKSCARTLNIGTYDSRTSDTVYRKLYV